MSKPSFSNQDFTKHREGPTRELRLNEWYENLDAHRAAQKYFTGETVVPNNPNNQQSYVPKKSMHEPPGSSDADNVFYRNPYGDAEKVEQAQVPVLSKNPTQFGKYFAAPAPDPKLDRPNFVQTPGPGSEMSQPRFGKEAGDIAIGGGFMGDRNYYSKTPEEQKAYRDSIGYSDREYTGEKKEIADRNAKKSAPKKSKRARGTNTGFGGFGAGPQREVEARNDARQVEERFRNEYRKRRR